MFKNNFVEAINQFLIRGNEILLKIIDVPLKSDLYEKNATIYFNDEIEAKGCVIYFHGGGLLYGNRKDLPNLHVQKLTSSGFIIFSCDYPLAPVCKLDLILKDINSTIENHRRILSDYFYSKKKLPYFLWGRSAGAYLALISSLTEKKIENPSGIISYYGYGFLCDNWYGTPSKFYLKLPKVPETFLENISKIPHATGDLSTHYSIYVYARQTGKWKDLIYEGRDKFFYLNYSLKLCEKLNAPLFCAHSVGDPDVPFSEFTELCNRYNAKRFVAAADEHDFDRHTENPFTTQLLDATISFLNRYSEDIKNEKRLS